VPTIGRKIDEENANDPDLRINLAGIGIGDGLISPRDTAVYAEYLYQVTPFHNPHFNVRGNVRRWDWLTSD